jgi:hypothetical protein
MKARTSERTKAKRQRSIKTSDLIPSGIINKKITSKKLRKVPKSKRTPKAIVKKSANKKKEKPQSKPKEPSTPTNDIKKRKVRFSPAKPRVFPMLGKEEYDRKAGEFEWWIQFERKSIDFYCHFQIFKFNKFTGTGAICPCRG